jgi:hypothetical protein
MANSWDPELALIMNMDVPIILLHQSSGDLAGNRDGRRALSMRRGCFDLLATQIYAQYSVFLRAFAALMKKEEKRGSLCVIRTPDFEI